METVYVVSCIHAASSCARAQAAASVLEYSSFTKTVIDPSLLLINLGLPIGLR